MHTENKIDDKFSKSGFGKSLEGEQTWPPKLYRIVVRQGTDREMEEGAQSNDPKPGPQASQT